MRTTMGRSWMFLLVLYSHSHVAFSTVVNICTKNFTYTYEMDECPGGIQLRNDENWMTKPYEKLCICGEGSILQFDGEGEPWHEWIYPPDFPKDSIAFIGSWKDYNLKPKSCEALRRTGAQPSSLLISTRAFQNPANFPSRAMEVIVQPTEHKRLAGSYSIEIKRGLESKAEAQHKDLLKTIIMNTAEPVLLHPDMENRPWDKLCAYNPTKPEVILSKYISTSWNVTNIEKDCKEGNIPTYLRKHSMCKTSCESNPTWTETAEKKIYPSKEDMGLLKFFEFMAEVSIRMKNADKQIPFTRDNEPHVAILQQSSRIFYKAFPNVVKWETLLNAVTIFGIAFEGLIPASLRGEKFDQIRLALGRCTLQQEKDHERNTELYNQICAALPEGPPLNKVKRQVKKPMPVISQSKDSVEEKAPAKPQSSPAGTQARYVDDRYGQFNKLVDLLWKMVQFSQIKCLSNLEHHPNVLHYYVEAMLEVFSSPAVQILWHHNTNRMHFAMLHILPELPDNALTIIDGILEKTEYSTYFNVLQRTRIKDLESRDMACAGHGKLIWGGKACCYFEEDDKKYRFYNRVAFAKL